MPLPKRDDRLAVLRQIDNDIDLRIFIVAHLSFIYRAIAASPWRQLEPLFLGWIDAGVAYSTQLAALGALHCIQKPRKKNRPFLSDGVFDNLVYYTTPRYRVQIWVFRV